MPHRFQRPYHLMKVWFRSPLGSTSQVEIYLPAYAPMGGCLEARPLLRLRVPTRQGGSAPEMRGLVGCASPYHPLNLCPRRGLEGCSIQAPLQRCVDLSCCCSARICSPGAITRQRVIPFFQTPQRLSKRAQSPRNSSTHPTDANNCSLEVLLIMEP